MAKKNLNGIDLHTSSHPVLYEVNTRVLLRELSASGKKTVTLAAIPDAVFDEWVGHGVTAVWMMGVWSSGSLGISIARSDAALQEMYRAVLPDYSDDDVGGSPYAVQAYDVPATFGGNEGLKKLRARLAERRIGLVLDFVPNHTARDHSWVTQHPEYYVQGRDGEEREKPDLYFCARTRKGDLTMAYGRDPGYAGWTDTAQLNPMHAGAREALIDTLVRIAGMCDGVRCDMAMLVLRGVFERTWGERAKVAAGSAEGEFWRDAIAAVRARVPRFMFIAEAYWNMEWDLQQLGFDYTYDKTFFDRLLREGAGSVRDHLRAEMAYQMHSLRFIENHDEQRVAHSLPSQPWQYAAATVIATVPGMVMFHDGQFEGRTVKLPVQLTRRPPERTVEQTQSFYARLLGIIANPVFQNGSWRLLMPRAAWQENHSWQNFLVFWWHKKDVGTRLVVVNYAPLSGQAYVDIPLDEIGGSPLEFRDLLSEAVYTRDRGGLGSKGMYFDLPDYGLHIFEVSAVERSKS